MRVPIPNKFTPFLEADGKTVSQVWFDYISFVDRQLLAGLSGQPDVKITSLLNSQVLIWNAADSKWENGTN